MKKNPKRLPQIEALVQLELAVKEMLRQEFERKTIKKVVNDLLKEKWDL